MTKLDNMIDMLAEWGCLNVTGNENSPEVLTLIEQGYILEVNYGMYNLSLLFNKL